MQIDGWTLLLQLINLLVLLALLRWLFYRPLLRLIDERRRQVADAMAQAQATQAAADARQQTLSDSQAALEASRQAVLSEARAEAARERDAAAQRAQQAAQAAMDDAQHDIAAARRDAATHLSDEAAQVAQTLATRLLSQAPEGGDAGFLEAALAQVRQAAAAQRRAWLDADKPPSAQLVSAHPLDAAAQRQASEALRELVSPELTLSFAVDAALIRGVELRFDHAVVANHWADALASAKAALQSPPSP
ncbi:MAG: hypothetical protein KF871_14400 [Hydrogenophaga sp.]|uniref:F0F1 ATP synthase subunit B family protein n=1 Tax=Hydrogenophaga sp. TaxID=1904254 RepID=UPI001D639580|nr:hypothetical protein [Hydrogenophaga sp.]MBX3611078.1 hypothetical protein [Hydrogenophaga sp.]